MKEKNEYDIFISYRREDGAIFAEALSNNLIEKGYRVFFDKRELRPGCNFPDELKNNILNSKEFIAIVSDLYFANTKIGINIGESDDWVHKEIKYALKNPNLNILPILISKKQIDSKSLSEDIREISNRNYFIYDNKHDTIDKIVSHLLDQFHPETRENALIGTVIKEINQINVSDNKEFNVLCKSIISHINSKIELKALNHILEYELNSEYYYDNDYRFVAFYVLFSYYRRMHYFLDLINLVEKYRDYFYNYNFFFYAMTEYYNIKFFMEEDDDIRTDYLNKLLEVSDQALNKIRDNNGIIHSYCLSIAIANENGLRGSNKFLSKALNLIDSVIEKDKTYARYYATKARLLACISEYDLALKNINYAQIIERPDFGDWMLRISEYRKYECLIRIKKLEDTPK